MNKSTSKVIKIVCPSCEHRMSITSPKSGSFKPRCKKCDQRFSLVVKSDSSHSVSSLEPVTEQTRLDVGNPSHQNGESESADSMPPILEPETQFSEQSGGPRQRVSGRLGGYNIIKLLGAGGMGHVYLAQQVSLERLVALKLVQAKWANNASMIARLTREAYAAAQLNHHNVVQIYDLCSENDTKFFTMEYIDGPSLGDLVKQHGRLDPHRAASYVLQAARGLQSAHSHGMVHRDIKPANLLLSPDGVVKVADLGLVKIPELPEIDSTTNLASLSGPTHLTSIYSAVGTASYIAPEQANDAGTADHRSDIYSLGCTFYVLLTGQPPFQGESIEAVISQHHEAELVRPDVHSEHIPSEFSDIVSKMMAKKPSDRFANIGQLITKLESILGVQSDKGFSPDEQQVESLAENAKQFAHNSLATARNLGPTTIFAGLLLVALIFVTVPGMIHFRLAFSIMVTAFITPLATLVVAGFRERSYLFERCRIAVRSFGVKSWLQILVAAALATASFVLTGTTIYVLVAISVSIGLAFLFDLAIAQQLIAQRAVQVNNTKKLLRHLRMQGISEPEIQRFVADYAGDEWEEFFEVLFGYESKRRLRRHLERTEIGRRKKKFWAWRDGIADRVDRKINAKKRRRIRKHIERVEEEGLKAQGIDATEARAQAHLIAGSLIEDAAKAKIAQAEHRLAPVDPAVAAQLKRDRVKAMLSEARNGKIKIKKLTFWDRYHKPLDLVFGPQIRFIIGGILIGICWYWAYWNSFLAEHLYADVFKNFKQAIRDFDGSAILQPLNVILDRPTNALGWPIIGWIFNSFSIGIAGIMLLFSVVCNGPKFAFFGYPAALFMIFGPLAGIPGIPLIGSSTASCVVIGIGIALAGVVLSYYDED